ncbi:hypothetical protein BH11MYX1_BH11MYX1_23920 [soil metagenome]
MSRVPLVVALVAACSSKKESAPDPLPVPVPETPLRDAEGDKDIRALVNDLIAGKACHEVEHRFSGIRDVKRAQTLVGSVWIRECQIENEGSHLAIRIAASGWEWVDQTQKKAGGTFVVKQYVKFDVVAKLAGTIDLAYDPKVHVASLWYTPTAVADVQFKPRNDIDVDSEGAWSSILGGTGALIGKSPDETAEQTAVKKGATAVQLANAKGVSVAVDLCTNTVRMSGERLPKGKMPKPSIGESERINAEVQNFGVLEFGPYAAPTGMTLAVDVEGGSAQMYLACVDQAEVVAAAFLEGKPNNAKPLTSEVISGKGTLHAPKERCPVVVVVRSIQPTPVKFTFVRPAAEATASKGGPLLHCGK